MPLGDFGRDAIGILPGRDRSETLPGLRGIHACGFDAGETEAAKYGAVVRRAETNGDDGVR